jgi:archaellum component FlaC
MTPKEYEQLKAKWEQEQKALEKAKARLEVGWEQIQKQFDCSTIEEVEDKIKELQANVSRIEENLEDTKKEYESKWTSKI